MPPKAAAPVEEVPSDPSATNVKLTAWVQVECESNEAAKQAKCDLSWYGGPDGKTWADLVDVGVVSDWSKLESVADPSHENPSLRFKLERETQQWATCDFIRAFAANFLKVEIKSRFTETGGEPVSESEAVVKTVVLSLARLLLAPSLTVDGSCEVREEVRALLPGFTSMAIGVQCTGQLLGEEIASKLNPLLVKLHAVHRLPCDDTSNDRRNTFAILRLFGEEHKADMEGLVQLEDASNANLSPRTAKGKVVFDFYKLFFLGHWSHQGLIQRLETEQLVVEVHDQNDSKESNDQHIHGCARVSLADLAAASIGSCNSVGPPMMVRAALEPVCNRQNTMYTNSNDESPGEDTGNPPCSARSGSLVLELFGQGAKEELAAKGKITHTVVPGYLQSGSFISLELTLRRRGVVSTRPPVSPLAGMECDPDGVDPVPPVSPSAGMGCDQDGKGQNFARIAFILDYRCTTIPKELCCIVRSQNVNALGLDEVQARNLSLQQLTEEQQSDPSLDIITGFVVMDQTMRLIVVEGRRDSAMQRVVDELRIGEVKNSKQATVLFHPSLGFSRRLYGRFGPCLKHIKFRHAAMESLAHRPDLCLSARSDRIVSEALQCLTEIKRSPRLHMLKATDSFPSAEGLIGLETQYGDFVADEELEGGCVD